MSLINAQDQHINETIYVFEGDCTCCLRKHRGKLPATFKFDRLEANERA